MERVYFINPKFDVMNDVFFSENGLTSTSANHIANLAKEYVQDIESRLANIKLYKSEVALIGTETRNLLSDGWGNAAISEIGNLLQTVTEAKSLIAWLREAIKARSQALNEAENVTIEEWAVERGITLPERPQRKDKVDDVDIIAAMNVKERNRILALQTKAATFGKYVHPDGGFSKARKNYLKRMSEPVEVNGEGRDAMFYYYTPSCDEANVEEVFFALQKIHRETQAELNKIQHEVSEKVLDENQKAEAEYYQALSNYQVEMEKFQSQFKYDKAENLKKLAALKIVIPNDLKGIYETVNKLGK